MHTSKIFAGLALAGVCLALAATDGDTRIRATPVPPTMEIEVIEPRAHPTGMPAVTPVYDPSGALKIDIPPTVIVHKYYYTGDRSFQSRFLPGGPCIVVANHPRTGERLYIHVQMLPGAPRIIYRSDSIEYDYGNQGIEIEFCCLCKKPPRVEYRNGPTFASKVKKATDKAKETAKNVAARTGITEAKVHVKETSKNFAATTLDTFGEVTKTMLIPIQRLGSMIPGSQMLTSSPEDRATKLRDAKIRAAEAKNQFKDADIRSPR